ncbi:hypothetical protein [Flavivirga sp. 57AJ16]|uniref:hypothetical protein n=1 Tax=Flavivirga sp. 57AJ16 TaxID=3025307 RepID=UPI002365C542|nr:hypothetical protein [Flavivirga sp. 57AJ16]MDD7886034.1 hypothetical protein [Flavivirga sp. 57AJ16]
MKKLQLPFLKPITIFGFIIILIISSIATKLYAQGPNAPEAASFEPIDATDMVNLSTGDFTYVLPIINVPSPEGGYPLALAYHAGIAMDQEASWTGLGWNLNAGAINRSVNGYPDDYNNVLLTEYFYDEGDEESIYSLSLGYSAYGAASVGLGFSWGSNRSLGGYVSVGYGFDLGGDNKLGGSIKAGTDGVGVNLGLTTSGGLSVGVGASTNGGLGGSIGFDNNGTGFSVSSNGSVNISIAQESGKDNTVSLGITLSSNGIGIDAGVTNKTGNDVDGGLGGGLNLQFENTVNMGNYTTKTSGWQVPLSVPTPIGVFSLSFGKQKFRYYLGKKDKNIVNGPIYFYEGTSNQYIYTLTAFHSSTGQILYRKTFDSLAEATAEANSIPFCQSGNPDANCSIDETEKKEAFMDIYEVPLDANDFSIKSKMDIDNAIFPSYDNYNIQAQGLSGSMSSRLFENGNLFGLANKENNLGYELRYSLDGSTTDFPNYVQFDSKPYFYLDNEISTYLGVNEASFNYNTANSDILSYYNNGVELTAKPRRKNATYVDYFTNEDISANYNSIKSNGYLLPEIGYDALLNSNIPEDAIGAFKITSLDGKTYHYSLPVYNHETVTRTFGTIAARPNESQSYFEKRQLEPYATHWLLTAITGPDFFDTNNNGVADKGDYGYWVAFEYGKWSDAFAWKSPYAEDYFIDQNNSDIKTWIRGRKQVYYLDKVKTRTHTALFIKSPRNDALSSQWNYKSVVHLDDEDQTSSAYQARFTIPEQEPLKLDKIILVKEEDDTLDRTYSASNENHIDILYNNSSKPLEEAWYNLKDNVLDISDNINSILPKALKVVDFQYDNSLVVGRPRTNLPSYGSLTLKSVHFKGKQGEELIPSYSFGYNNTSYTYNKDDKDGFGYYINDNSLWSLNEITTPQGGKIQINYENNKFKSVVGHTIIFKENDENFEASIYGSDNKSYSFKNLSNMDYNFLIGQRVDISFNRFICDGQQYVRLLTYSGKGTVTQQLGTQEYLVTADAAYSVSGPIFNCVDLSPKYHKNVLEITAPVDKTYVYNNGGVRVSSLVTTDGTTSNTYTTKYNYGENGDGIGYISYLPFAPELQKELPYSAELPPPRVMYEYVSMEALGADNQSEGKIQYKFKVLKEKEANDIKFGDLYEIDVTTQEHTNNTANKDVVVSSYTVKDNLAALGQLLEVSTFNNEDHLLSKIENTYYSPTDQTPNQVGVTKEAYQTYKIVDYTDNTSQKDRWLVNSSARIKYPNLLKHSTEYKGGFEFTSEFGELDGITGRANEILSVASDGTEIKSKSVPAYHKYPDMGSKVDDVDNENMLSQNTANYTFIKDPVSGNWKETGVEISTWNNNWSYRSNSGSETLETDNDAKVWRRHKEYVWEGDLNDDGTLKNFSDNFNWASTSQSSEWKEVSEITKYSRYSSPLEFKDINDNRASTKMGDKDSKVLATGNSWYGEMYYSGAEYKSGGIYLENEIKGAVYQSSEKWHTGKYSVKLNTGNEFGVVLKANEHRAERYKISVWVHKDNYFNAQIKIGSGSSTVLNGEVTPAGDWVLMNHYMTLSASEQNVVLTSGGGNVYFDDFRIHPMQSSMTTYVYNEWDELTFITDANNLSVCFVYDSQGRLTETYSEIIDVPGVITGGFKKTSENIYNYKNQ